MSPAAEIQKPPEVAVEPVATEILVEDLKSEPIEAMKSEPIEDEIVPEVKPVKKLSELAAKKSVPEPEKSEKPVPVKNPLDALPEPKTKSEKPGAKIEEIFAKLEEEQKLKESKRQQNMTLSPKKSENQEKPKEVAEMAAILSTMKKTQPPAKNVDSMSSAISKLIGKPAASTGSKTVENEDPSEPMFPTDEIENSAEITGSDLQLPFSENEGIVVGQA